MPLLTYEQVRPIASAILDAMKSKRMPPAYSDQCCGKNSTPHEIPEQDVATIDAWISGGALEGRKKDAPKPVKFFDDWRIDGPSVSISLPRPFEVAANAKVDEQVIVFPLDFSSEKWVRSIEIHPGDRALVHHAILYARSRTSDIAPLTMTAKQAPIDGEILAVYTPASPATNWPEEMGKKIPQGSQLVLEIHYVARKFTAHDRTSIGMNFFPDRPRQRILTLPVSSPVIVPRDAMLLNVVPPVDNFAGALDFTPFFRTTIDPRWQPNISVKPPKLLPRGMRLSSSATVFLDIAVDLSVERTAFATSPH
jgi:hypothetical protein